MYSGSYKIKDIPHLATGLNNRYDAGEIADTDIADMENIEVDGKTIRSAAGYVNYGSAQGKYWGGFNARFENGTERMIRQRGTSLEYDSGAGVWTACTIPAALTETPSSFAMLNNIILYSNGFDAVLSSSDGITWVAQAALPKSRKLFNNGLNRILFLAQPLAPSRVDWCNINDPLTISASAYQFFGKNDGQEIQDAVLTPNGGMFLFKTNRFYAISDITMDTVSTEPIGEAPCVRGTACTTENSVMWAGPDGSIYEYAGGIPNKISDNIAPLGITNQKTMTAVYRNGRYRLAVPEGSNTYNSIEYVVHRNLLTGNPKNPYVITKNRRNIGTYIPEDREEASGRRSRVYFGDSVSSASSVFAWVNEEHDASVTQGLNGSEQTCFFTTKFFTEFSSFFAKRFVRYFINLKTDQSATVKLGYRFYQYDSFIETNMETSEASLDFVFDDFSVGGFSEGFAFSSPIEGEIFKDLERTSREARGVQLRVSWVNTNDVEVLSQAVKYLVKRNFR